MPGAYAHIATVHSLISDNILEELDIPNEIKLSLGKNLRFASLGAVSPDYPYLDLGNKKSCEWADEFHAGGQNKFIIEGLQLIHQMPNGSDKQKCIAWIFGVISHAVLDMVLHPIVEQVAGIYSESKENQKKHRICEMHQDVYIWKQIINSTIGKCEAIDHLRLCGPQEDELLPQLKNIWNEMLKQGYPDLYSHNKPDIEKWHNMFPTIVDVVENSEDWPRFARHVASDAGVAYPNYDELDAGLYLKNLKDPYDRRWSYDELYDKALGEIKIVWEHVARSLDQGDFSNLDNVLGDWNMDRGLINGTGEYYLFWKEV